MQYRKKHPQRIIGEAPGTLRFLGEKTSKSVKITSFSYTDTFFEEKELKPVDIEIQLKNKSNILWLNIDGLHDVELIENIGKIFEIHPLILEDILSTTQRPKLQQFDHYIFLGLKMFYFKENQTSSSLKTENVSMILGENYVITFQEEEGDVFSNLRERLRKSKGRIRKKGADYLLYALIDSIVDNYFVVLDAQGDSIEDLEINLIDQPSHSTIEQIHRLKLQFIELRKSIWPIRELISTLEHSDSNLIQDDTNIFFRDIYEHSIEVIENVEAQRDILSGMIDIYLSSVSNKMNDIMRVLTIISTIFIPLTLISSIYGMNFEFMPELHNKYGYPIALLSMVFISFLLLFIFRKKKWM